MRCLPGGLVNTHFSSQSTCEMPVPTGQMNLSSMTAHLLRTGCRITVICSPDTSRTQFRATRRCEAVELSVDSVGIAMVCRPRCKPRKSSASPATLKSVRSESTNSTMPAGQVCCSSPKSGVITSPAKRAGLILTMITRRSTLTTWKVSCGRSKHCGTRA